MYKEQSTILSVAVTVNMTKGTENNACSVSPNLLGASIFVGTIYKSH